MNTHTTKCRAAWSNAVDQFDGASQALNKHGKPDKLDRLADRYAQSEQAVFDMPAPDLPALRWKLERLLAIDPDGTTSGWSGEHVQQTLADIQRLIPA